MSVVVRFREINGRKKDDDNIFVFVKGADNVIADLAAEESQKYYESEIHPIVQQFADEGLRTLVCGFAVHSLEWWGKWEERLKSEMTDEEREKLEIEFDQECGYHICGVTAVEDELQECVPETIAKLMEANIRVWMLTGDKKETAINIGKACNLLSNDLTNRIEMNENNALEILEKFDQSQYDEPTIELVLEGKGLHVIFDRAIENKDETIIERFTELALSCRSVVSCRLQPNQKAQIVKCIMQKTGLVCLAIGDGANDVPMIKQGSIGVGLQGLEGTAAARNSDYVIARFQFLIPLLFVHGRYAYRGTCFMILYLLWKNSMFTFLFLWFATFSGFSGTNPMLDYIYQIFNTFPTGFPIFAYVLYDYDIKGKILYTFPILYGITNGHNNETRDLKSLEQVRDKRAGMFNFDAGTGMNVYQYLKLTAEAFVQSVLFMMILYCCWQDAKGYDNDGHSWGIMICGSVIWIVCTVLANVRMIIVYSTISKYHIIALTISLFSSILAYIVFDTTTSFRLSGVDWYGLVSYFIQTPYWWYIFILTCSTPILISLITVTTFGLFGNDELFPYKDFSKKHIYS